MPPWAERLVTAWALRNLSECAALAEGFTGKITLPERTAAWALWVVAPAIGAATVSPPMRVASASEERSRLEVAMEMSLFLREQER